MLKTQVNTSQNPWHSRFIKTKRRGSCKNATFQVKKNIVVYHGEYPNKNEMPRH
jgi:hypothetical protein